MGKSEGPSSSGRPILITGANGLLGQKLSRRLAREAGVRVLATGRGHDRLTDPPTGHTYHELDVADPKAIARLLDETCPGAVIHTAAMTHVDQCEQDPVGCRRANVEATANLARACAERGIYLLHLSTDFIFDGLEGPYDEEALPNPISYYGHSKWDAERVIASTTGLAWGIARTILVYGVAPGLSRSNIVQWVESSLRAGKSIQVVDDQYRTPTLARDLAEGCARMALGQVEGIYNLGGPELLTPYQMALATARYFDLEEGLIERTDSTKFKQPARRPPRTGLVIDKARRDFGYDPVPFAAGIPLLAD